MEKGPEYRTFPLLSIKRLQLYYQDIPTTHAVATLESNNVVHREVAFSSMDNLPLKMKAKEI